jgi:hypothetical protein
VTGNRRRGYYSSPQQHPTSEQGIAALLGALQPGMPPATMLCDGISAASQGQAEDRKDQLHHQSQQCDFQRSAGEQEARSRRLHGHRLRKDGREAAHASDTLDGAIPQAAYDAVMKQGLPVNQEIELNPGTYNLRLGVMDHATQQIGTVDVPLEISDQSIGK